MKVGHTGAMRGRPQEVLCSVYFLSYNGIGSPYGNKLII